VKDTASSRDCNGDLNFWCQGIYTVRWFHGWNPQDNAGDKCLGNMIRKLAACIFSHQLCIQSCWGSLIVHSHISIIFSALSCWSCCCSLLLSSAPLVPSEIPSLLTCSSCKFKLTVYILLHVTDLRHQCSSKSVLIRTLHCMHQNAECRMLTLTQLSCVVMVSVHMANYVHWKRNTKWRKNKVASIAIVLLLSSGSLAVCTRSGVVDKCLGKFLLLSPYFFSFIHFATSATGGL